MSPPPPRSAATRVSFVLRPDAQARTALARLAREVANDALGRVSADVEWGVALASVDGVGEPHWPALRDAGERAAAAVSPFALTLERVGGSSYRTAWFAPDGMPASLRALHDAVVDALRGAGLDAEPRMFRPHVVLARECARRAHVGGVASIAWRVERLSLAASGPELRGGGFRELGGWPLARTPRQGTATV
ncbi:hypothetical protein BURK1_01657 [Burkholderiales bacterium]|nr:hypothetical protein BURK1_01657 [Burkholderiales bacterium]